MQHIWYNLTLNNFFCIFFLHNASFQISEGIKRKRNGSVVAGWDWILYLAVSTLSMSSLVSLLSCPSSHWEWMFCVSGINNSSVRKGDNTSLPSDIFSDIAVMNDHSVKLPNKQNIKILCTFTLSSWMSNYHKIQQLYQDRIRLNLYPDGA